MRLSIALALVVSATPCISQRMVMQESHTTENLRGISVVAHHVAWASGTHGTYLRTLDGGNNWDPMQVPGAEALDFRDVEAFSADVAYLLSAGPGDQSRIYKTTDAGRHWTLQFTNSNLKGFFDCMSFWDADHGIAVGDPVDGSFELITTEDGGLHWKTFPPDLLPRAIEGEGAFAASGTCLAIQGRSNVWFATGGKAARVYRSSDRGHSWAVSETPVAHGPESAGIFSIAFHDAKHGVVAGGDYKHPEQGGANLAYTDDGGSTWRLSKVSPQFYFSAVIVRKRSLFVAGSSRAGYAASNVADEWKRFWDLNVNALAADTSGDVIAVGPQGTIIAFKGIR